MARSLRKKTEVVATNVPTRYANLVYKIGIEALIYSQRHHENVLIDIRVDWNSLMLT